MQLKIVLKCAAQRVQSRTNSRQPLGRPILDERLASVASEAAGRIQDLCKAPKCKAPKRICAFPVLLAEVLSGYFPPEVVQVVCGDGDLGSRLLEEERFDHTSRAYPYTRHR